MVRESVIVAAVLLACAGCAAAACPSVAVSSRAYIGARDRVAVLPEFQAWRRYVDAHPPARVFFGLGALVEQKEIGGECFTPVTIYSDEGTHFHRWNTFYLGSRSHRVLVENLEGEPISLQAWRLSNKSAHADAQHQKAAPRQLLRAGDLQR